jgi:tetratricopeptide (TPR) repeat protein
MRRSASTTRGPTSAWGSTSEVALKLAPLGLIAAALVAIAIWPAFASHAVVGDPTAASTPAPLRDDATIRAKTIAFEERREKQDSEDQITPRLLAEQYLQRYRERGDAGDIVRAQAAAQRSLRAQPDNVPALQALASAQLALHRFRDALATVRRARATAPNDPGLAMSEAAFELELGDYRAAEALLARQRAGARAAGSTAAGTSGAGGDPTEAIAARLAELTGDLPRARDLLGRASRRLDAIYGAPNERRAWFHARLGELAFAAGDTSAALGEEKTALERFPDDLIALTDAARFSAAGGAWNDVRGYAEHAVRLTPSPENLGLLADAQEHLGDANAAAATRDEIVAVERIGNAQHLVDRLLAVYYADHGVRLADAYVIARRDLAVRDDVFAEDTLAWTAARAGKWDVARAAARKATAYDTAEPRLWYHAGVIAEHDGDTARAKMCYQHALALNPNFQAGFADDARARLAHL